MVLLVTHQYLLLKNISRGIVVLRIEYRHSQEIVDLFWRSLRLTIRLNTKLPLIVSPESIYFSRISFYYGMIVAASNLSYELIFEAFYKHRSISWPNIVVAKLPIVIEAAGKDLAV